MSLINQMLQDLDARRAAHGVGVRLPNDVRPLPKAPSSNWPLGIAIGVGLISILGIGFVWRGEVAGYFAGQTTVVASEPQPVVVPPVVASPVPVPVEPTPASPSGSVDPPEPPVGPIDPDAKSLVAGVEVSLRMADFLDAPGKSAGEPSTQAAPVEPSVVPALAARTEKRDKKDAGSSTTVPASQHTSDAADRAVQKPVAGVEDKPGDTRSQGGGKSGESAPLIERTPAAGSPREQAESEYRKAIAAVNQGRVPEALDSLRTALRLDAFRVAARQLLVKLLLEVKNQDEAIQVLQEGIGGQPAQIGWAMSLARLQIDRGDPQGAWRTLEHSLPAAGNSPDYLGFAANVLQRLGRHDEAAVQYRKAAHLAPADGRWWLGLGWCLDAQGSTAESREAFLRAKQSGNLTPELLTLVEQKLR